jgi:hypothetical protein
VEVADAEGHVVAWSSNLTNQQLTIPTPVLDEARQRGGSFVKLRELRIAVVPLSSDRSKQLGFAIVAEPLSVVAEGLRRLRLNFFAGVPLILLFASLGGYFLARKSLSPIALMNPADYGRESFGPA